MQKVRKTLIISLPIFIIMLSLVIGMQDAKSLLTLKQFLFGEDVVEWNGGKIIVPLGIVSRQSSDEKISFFSIEEKDSEDYRRNILWIEKDEDGEGFRKISKLCDQYKCNGLNRYFYNGYECTYIENAKNVDFKKMEVCYFPKVNTSLVIILSNLSFEDKFMWLKKSLVTQISNN